MDEREILRIAVRHDIDQYLTEALTLEFVRDVLKAARCTTPDREGWISVSESVPQTADFVLAVNKLGAIKCTQYWHGEWIGMGGVTHWMPLPAAPTSDQGEKS
ncbi:DUF551 domain-containing protein [Burkholderia multivorans]|uniref:DUF551 domain-containing protein n=1 Tax=Burkholderia multivorans TaxID=87883 RepID=UPI001C220DAC|nr:DUF551 domain-containing protein [Burkholderia multivorans]MBU9668559.1 DUF551 domain-containing protein [Burkholderia multivorans]HEF4752191.1 DUF551 domain-containing protein [Burkholderia multivorans]